MEYKINDNQKNEKLKNFELEKATLMTKNDMQISIIRKEYDLKLNKLKDDIGKIDFDNKLKEDLLINNNSTNDKMSSLIKQKVNFIF